MASHWKNASSILALAVAATFGCSSAYMPRPSRRVSFIQSGGAVNLTRDSRSLSMWDADVAVVGNPTAEAEARTYVHHMSAGLLLDFAGLGLIGAGAVIGGQSASSTRNDAGAGLVVGGCVSIAVAIALLVTAWSHLYDAVNIYNDGLPPEPSR